MECGKGQVDQFLVVATLRSCHLWSGFFHNASLLTVYSLAIVHVYFREGLSLRVLSCIVHLEILELEVSKIFEQVPTELTSADAFHSQEISLSEHFHMQREFFPYANYGRNFTRRFELCL